MYVSGKSSGRGNSRNARGSKHIRRIQTRDDRAT